MKEMLKKLYKYVIERAVEKSTVLTWLTVGAGFFGATISPENADVISGVITSIVIAIATFTKEEK